MLDRWKDKERNPLSNHETAKIVRERMLDLGFYGVRGSDSLIPNGREKGAVSVPALLNYSTRTKEYFRTFLGVLRSPREFKIVEQPNQSWEDDTPDGDVIHSTERIGEIYMFANHHTSPYLGQLSSALDSLNRQDPMLDVSIIGHKNGLWSARYSYFIWSCSNVFQSDYIEANYAIDLKRTESGFYTPEKGFLLNFLCFPRIATPADLVGSAILPLTTARHLRFKERKMIGNFEVTNWSFDTEGLIKELERRRKRDLDRRPGVLYQDLDLDIYGLKKRKNQVISVVRLGKIDIGGRNYYVYSGSETPLTTETVRNLVPGLSGLKQTPSMGSV